MALGSSIIICFSLFLAAGLADRLTPNNHFNVSSSKRSGKIFSLFNVVKFQNDHCTASSDSDITGTCLTSGECSSQGGSKDGNCAAGFGVCCVITVSDCSSTITKNCTYVQNTEFPSSAAVSTTCSYTFDRICPDLCQIRLDFDNLVTAQPPSAGTDETGDCATSGDFLDVTSPSGSSPPRVCGTLTGQHMYLETGTTGNAGSMTFTFGDTASVKTYRVKVTYYECNSRSRAPSDCVQYYTGVSGTIISYNYPNQLLDEQDYASCIRQEAGYCSINYHQSPSTGTETFDLYDDNIAVQDSPTDPRSATTADCQATYVSIPSSSTGGAASMFCGGLLASDDASSVASTVSSDSTPFVLSTIAADDLGDGAPDAILGYSIDYTQQPC